MYGGVVSHFKLTVAWVNAAFHSASLDPGCQNSYLPVRDTPDCHSSIGGKIHPAVSGPPPRQPVFFRGGCQAAVLCFEICVLRTTRSPSRLAQRASQPNIAFGVTSSFPFAGRRHFATQIIPRSPIGSSPTGFHPDRYDKSPNECQGSLPCTTAAPGAVLFRECEFSLEYYE